jgi:hypothetical protein
MLIVLPTILIIGFTYQKSQQEPSKITVTIGDKELQYVTAKNKWKGRVYDREDTFKTMMKEASGFEIPYFEIGTNVVIDFKKYPPEKFTVSDILLNKDGNKMYSSIRPISIPFKLKNGKYSFQINKNMETLLDSNWVTNKTYSRGFRLTASWGKNECEYAFIVKTDR